MSLGTLKTKVGLLIEKVNHIKWFKDTITGISFSYNNTITSLTLDCESFKTLNASFANCTKLNSLYLSNTQNVADWRSLIHASNSVRTLEILDFSSATSIDSTIWNVRLENLKVVPETIKIDFVCQLRNLTLESGKSILLGLYNYSGTDMEFIYSVTLSDEVLSLLEADGNTAPNGMTWVDYIDSIGWCM